MATIKATKNGLWSDTTVWDSATVPGVGDTAYSNGYTITIDQDLEVDSLSAGNGVDSHFSVSPGKFKISPVSADEEYNIVGDLISGLEINMVTDDTNVIINIIGNVGNGDKTIEAIYPEWDSGYEYSLPTGFPIVINITGDVRAQRKDEDNDGYASTISISGYDSFDMVKEATIQVNIIGDIVYPVDEDDGRKAGSSILYGYMCNGYNIVGNLRPEISDENIYGTYPISLTLSKITVKGSIYSDGTSPIINSLGGLPLDLLFPGIGISSIVGGIYLMAESEVVNSNTNLNQFPFIGTFFIEEDSEFSIPVHTFSVSDLDISIVNQEILTNAGGSGSGDCPEPQDVRKGVVYGDKTGLLAVPQPQQVAFGIPVDQSIGQAAISLPQLSIITGDQIEAAFER